MNKVYASLTAQKAANADFSSDIKDNSASVSNLDASSKQQASQDASNFKSQQAWNTALDSNAKTWNSNIDSLYASQKTHESDIATLDSSVDSDYSKIVMNSKNILENGSNVSDVNKDQRDNSTRINTLEANVA